LKNDIILGENPKYRKRKKILFMEKMGKKISISKREIENHTSSSVD